jgi:glycolate oxidase iron-sulfur subunit
MQHQIPLHQIGPQGPAMARAVERCVHCGFCLSACPTYLVLGEEMDSPRGRILLMKGVLEGDLKLPDALPYLDRCLGCLGCETACPSGVEYGELITPFRALAEEQHGHSLIDRLFRTLLLATLPYPGRFRLAVRLSYLARPLRRFLPGRLRAMFDLLPPHLPKSSPLPEFYPAQGNRRARVALLSGCVQQVLAPEINWATLRVLAANGVEVVIPKAQRCCGALSAHTGAARQARACARHNLDAFPKGIDAVLTNAAGCGSGMHEYPLWLAGQPEEKAAEAFGRQVKDVSEFLMELGPVAPPPLPGSLQVAYHDACHLLHAQKIQSQPRRLLAMIPGLKVVEVPDGEICCGSAGTYNIQQPAIAHELGQRKARAILSTGADAVAAGNIGCLMQIQFHLGQQGHRLPIYHTLELLDTAYRRVDLRITPG